MSRKAMHRLAVRERDDRLRLDAEREEYRDVVVGSPCPRCAAIAQAWQRDRERGIPPGSWCETVCWLCQSTGVVQAS